VYNLNYTPTISGMKVEEELYLAVCEQKRFRTIELRARGSVVVKALSYKPEGRGFDSR
jgi:hypothetical protein